jgi:S-adenosyl methyltransferase
VYVDNDPLFSPSAGAAPLVRGEPHRLHPGRPARPAAILADHVVRETLDFSQPVGLILVVVLLHFIPDDDKPAEIVATLLDALPSGSYLVASHFTSEHAPETRWAPG